MRILVLGGGGREHALAWKIAMSPMCEALFAAPGNAGIASVAECVALDIVDGAEVSEWCRARAIDLVVVGPEAPLVAGVADRLREDGIAVFGPSAAAARLEASKAFTHEIAEACGAPMAAWSRFTEVQPAIDWIRARGAPIVVKADGLAAGKGVTVCETVAEAEAAVEAALGGAFGAAGAEVVIEEFLEGEEASLFVLTDGEAAVALPGAQDHKRVGEGDTGPNTGGMGAYSPAPVLDAETIEAAMDRIVRPILGEMARRGTAYRGVLYAGLMIGAHGPRLVEINARFGDPECQVLMPRLRSDVLPALRAAATGGLADIELEWSPDPAMVVVLAASGYPGKARTGSEIRGLADAQSVEGVTVFHAGTRSEDGRLLAAGGRVLNVVATGSTLGEARARAYAAVDRIDWPGGFCRRDIGWRALHG